MKGFLLLVLFTLSIWANGLCQQSDHRVDSLEKQLSRTSVDTSRAKLYSRLSDLYIDIDLDKALRFADSSASIAKRNKWNRGIADGMLAIGNVYNFNGAPEKAIGVLNDAVKIYHQIGHKRGEGTSLYALGQSYERTSNFPLAVDYYFKSLQIQESLPNGDWDVAMCLSGISVIYYLQRDFEKSLDYSFKALKKKESLKNKTGVANELYNIGDTYAHMNDSVNSMTYNIKALEAYKSLGNKMGEANVYASLGKLLRKDYRRSLEYLNDAKKVFFEWDKTSPSLSLTDGQIGQVYLDMAKSGDTLSLGFKKKYSIPVNRSQLLDQSEKYLSLALSGSVAMGDKDSEYIFRGDLAEVQSLKGDHKSAYSNYKIFHHLRDSLYSQESKNKIANIEGQREVMLRDKEIALNKQALLIQQNRQIALSIGVVLLMMIGFLLYRQNRIRRLANLKLLELNAQLDEANKVKAKFFGILSHDLRSPIARLINFLHLQKEAPDLLTPDQNQKHQQNITASAEKLLDNMEDILLWSKGQMESFKPVMRDIAVVDLFASVENSFGGNASIQLSFKTERNLTIYSDENFVKTILQNLTANAVNVLREVNGSTIQWRAESNGPYVVLSIIDNGPGIDPEVKEKLFSNNEITSSKTGFGFHIVRDMAKAIGCELTLNSVAGGGTEFSLRFKQTPSPIIEDAHQITTQSTQNLLE